MYAIDQIENDIVIAENLKTKEKKEFKRSDFPFPIKEGTMFSIHNQTIQKEETIEQERRRTLREKMERLKRHE